AQEQGVVRGVIAVAAGPAGGEYAGHAVELVDGQAGVVGQAGKSGGVGAVVGLDQGVGLEGAAVLRPFGVVVDVVDGQQLDALDAGSLEQPGQLAQLFL